MTEPVRQGRMLRLAFVAAVSSLVVCYAASASPIPLFNTYRADDGFSNAGISLAVVTYSVGTVAALLVLGRLSNHLGRRPTGLATLGLVLLGCLLLLDVHQIAILLAGRLLMGLGVGLASSSLTSYIVDSAPARPSWLASVAASQSPMLGLSIGAIGSGALVRFGPLPRDLIYLVDIGLLLLCAVLIAVSPETATPTPGAWRSLPPRVHVPARSRHLLPVGTAIFVATWATGAFYQAFVPALIADQLSSHSPLVLGLVFSAYMAPSVLGAPIGGRLSAAAAQRLGMIIFLAGWIGILVALTTGALPLFIGASIIGGVGQGIAISTAIRGLLHDSLLADRAPIFAAVYMINYSGAVILVLAAGELSQVLSLSQITVGFGGIALIATMITALAARARHPGAMAEARRPTGGR